jgi:hypothetical protein
LKSTPLKELPSLSEIKIGTTGVLSNLFRMIAHSYIKKSIKKKKTKNNKQKQTKNSEENTQIVHCLVHLVLWFLSFPIPIQKKHQKTSFLLINKHVKVHYLRSYKQNYDCSIQKAIHKTFLPVLAIVETVLVPKHIHRHVVKPSLNCQQVIYHLHHSKFWFLVCYLERRKGESERRE